MGAALPLLLAQYSHCEVQLLGKEGVSSDKFSCDNDKSWDQTLEQDGVYTRHFRGPQVPARETKPVEYRNPDGKH